MKHFILIAFSLFLTCHSLQAKKQIFDLDTYAGIIPNATATYDNSARIAAALERISRTTSADDEIVIRFRRGRYDFFSTDAKRYDLYISNHDNPAQRAVGMMLQKFKNLTIEGNGAAFVFHGRMIPLYLDQAENTTLRNFSIDFADPQICEVEIVSNTTDAGISFRVPKNYNYTLQNYQFVVSGLDWSTTYPTGIAFDPSTHHILYRTSDLNIDLRDARSTSSPRIIQAPHWKDPRIKVGTRVALRTYFRPCPGIVVDHSKKISVEHVTVHYAEGMGLIAQLSEDITLRNFQVSLPTDNSRCFTTQADATHFSQCKGHIESVRGLYEGMMDDAINIHGIYLKVKEKRDSHTLRVAYEHEQCYGFPWGEVGDEVCFIRSQTMEQLPSIHRIRRIEPADGKTFQGCKEMWIELEDSIPHVLTNTAYGIENLSWTPTVRFAHNVVRNNRARGALFSSPRLTVCENNTFDHTSGTAILLCGDCNGWYESGAVRNLVIRKNKFINALTNLFQFTNAVISIYPEIPQLEAQQDFFHGGKEGAIRIVNNKFYSFDTPLLYAKSVKGLIFRKNRLIHTNAYPSFHWNQQPILLERVSKAEVEAATEQSK